MRFVTVKSVAQQDLLALHRVRAQLVKSSTALCNQLRGLLRERGVKKPPGYAGTARRRGGRDRPGATLGGARRWWRHCGALAGRRYVLMLGREGGAPAQN
jgi:transposase